MDDEKVENESEKKAKSGVSGLGDLISKAAKKSREVVKKALDRNDDGKIDLEDFGFDKDSLVDTKEKMQKLGDDTRQGAVNLAEKAGQGVKKGALILDQVISDSKLEWDRKTLRPVFSDDILPALTNNKSYLASETDSVYNIIRVVERDKKREESLACKGSIGYWVTAKNLEILNLYEDVAKTIGIHYHPVLTRTVYYIDPFQKNFYVNLDEYFNYLKKARVSELEMVASELGAKKVSITLKEWKSTAMAKKVRLKAKVNELPGFGLKTDHNDKGLVNMEIATNLTFSGHDNPRVPELVYFKGETDIEQLIKLRTNPEKKNQLISKTYSLEYNKSSVLKTDVAVDIGDALSSLKINSGVATEAQRESRTILEYHIEF